MNVDPVTKYHELPWFKRMDWVTALFLMITPLLALSLTPTYIATRGWDWRLIFLFVVYGAITNLIITAGYHRYLAHQAYQSSKWVRVMYLLLGAAAFQGSALKWRRIIVVITDFAIRKKIPTILIADFSTRTWLAFYER